MEVIVFFEPIKYFQSNDIQKNNKSKKLGEFCWTEKYQTIEEYVNIYNKKLFMRNYLSKSSEVHLNMNFVISDMKVYLVKFFLLNIPEAIST